MTTNLQTELKQTRPFATLQEEAFLSIVRTASRMTDVAEEVLKPFGIGVTQYNVLRILRGSEPGGLCRNDLRGRLLTRMPDVTRLLDRMEEAGLVERVRDTDDRRMVLTHITAHGRKLLSDLDGVVTARHQETLGHMSDADLRTLIDLLATARNDAQ